ncbi:MAG: 50S ribosomal protein L6 [uncultured bacterium]|nr:MAG: 50S ribosomal protein L6 [uncultured bacterium]
MSRTGKRPIALPEKVKARVAEQVVYIEGPLGKHQIPLSDWVAANVDGQNIVVTRKDDSGDAKRNHGLYRSLIVNAVKGVSQGFQKVLEIEGIGYRAELKGNSINMTLGYSHPIVYDLPQGIKAVIEKQVKITISGSDCIVVGQVAANIRSFRPPEPYKGKGIRYEGEIIQRKQGKAAAGSK